MTNIIYAPKLTQLFPKPNWIWFGNGRWIKCSCSAVCESPPPHPRPTVTFLQRFIILPEMDPPQSESNLSPIWETLFCRAMWYYTASLFSAEDGVISLNPPKWFCLQKGPLTESKVVFRYLLCRPTFRLFYHFSLQHLN